jgi:hypothetical protein
MPTEWRYPKSKRRFIFSDSEEISWNEVEDLLLRITQGGQPKLGRILDHFKIGEDVGQEWLHIAGNDANYTLRAVPLIAARQFDIHTGEDLLCQRRVERLK